jgi:chromosomal replication initiation ATPase DnaA
VGKKIVADELDLTLEQRVRPFSKTEVSYRYRFGTNHTFNAIHESGGHIVLSSDRPPRAMTILEDRLRSRFEWGLIADIQPPDYETRIAILRSKVMGPMLGSVPSDVLAFIAQKVQSNIRELEGSLNRLLAHARHMEQPVTIDLAAQALRDLVAPGHSGRVVTPNAILLAVARYFGVRVDDQRPCAAQADRGAAADRDVLLWRSAPVDARGGRLLNATIRRHAR